MRYFIITSLCIAFQFSFYSCVDHSLNALRGDQQLTIDLRWIKSYESETKEDVVKGLKWCFSFLGASLPKGSIATGLQWTSENNIALNIAQLGFSKEAEDAWLTIITALKNSEEYKIFHAIDIGRFVSLTLTSTNHYYKITGAENSYAAFRKMFSFDQQMAAVITSGVSYHSREIELSNFSTINDIAFVAHEGEGQIEEQTFREKEFEVINLMANGQLRFAIYDSLGRLKTSASPSLTRGGKPSKCLWCHEITLATPLFDHSEVNGFYSSAQFEAAVLDRMTLLRTCRKTLSSDVDFSLTQEHTKAELLYLGFMEPSVTRLAAEWGLPEVNVIEKLSTLDTHPQSEFSFLGTALYHRKEVESFAPYTSVRVADDAREPSVFEPDLF
jgi:hypothetical protein